MSGQYKKDSIFEPFEARKISSVDDAQRAHSELVAEHNLTIDKLNAELTKLERTMKQSQATVIQQILSGGGGGGGPVVGTHNLLSVTHPDTLPANVIRGDLIVGQFSTPLWARLPLGASGTYPRSNGTDLLYSAILDADLPATIVRTSRTLTMTGTAARLAVTGGTQDLSANRTWTFDIDAAYVGQASITTLGTITTGVWNGTTIAIANGGTGATTALGAFNNLSPLTTRGDFLTRDATNNIRLAIGAAAKYLRSDGTDPSWQTIASGDISNTSFVTSVSGTANRITSTGGLTPVIDISAAYVGQTSITTLGTITTGTWNGTTIAIANGGTGQTTALAAFNALSPLTTKGDLLTRDSTNNIRVAVGTDTQILVADSAQTAGIKWADPATATAHNILSATHSDTLTASVVRGDVIIGNSTPKWSRLAVGGASTLFQSNGTDPSWGTVNLLSAFHGDTLTGSVTRGDIIIGNSTPKWARLAVGSSGNFVGTDGTDVAWKTLSGTASQITVTNSSGNLTLSLSGGNFTGFANPSVNVTLSVQNGSATTAMRSDGAPALSQAIAPTWTGAHAWTSTTNPITVTQSAASSGSPTGFTFTGGAHTTLAASSEAIDVNYNLARNVQFATGALTTQRAFLIQAPTYRFVAASTLTTAATLAISGAPVAGTNATITNPFAIWVQGGGSRFDGWLVGSPGTELEFAL